MIKSREPKPLQITVTTYVFKIIIYLRILAMIKMFLYTLQLLFSLTVHFTSCFLPTYKWCQMTHFAVLWINWVLHENMPIIIIIVIFSSSTQFIVSLCYQDNSRQQFVNQTTWNTIWEIQWLQKCQATVNSDDILAVVDIVQILKLHNYYWVNTW